MSDSLPPIMDITGIFSVFGLTWNEADPVASINELLMWHSAMVLDPEICREARELRDTHLARAEAAEVERNELRARIANALS